MLSALPSTALSNTQQHSASTQHLSGMQVHVCKRTQYRQKSKVARLEAVAVSGMQSVSSSGINISSLILRIIPKPRSHTHLKVCAKSRGSSLAATAFEPESQQSGRSRRPWWRHNFLLCLKKVQQDTRCILFLG